MPTSSDPTSNENTYVVDTESSSEMARLLDQERLLTASMGGLFSERSDLSTIHDVLDIACGPGGWVHDVAQTYPEMAVVGIDISKTMIDYARAIARARKLDNADFRVMDALKSLDFPDESFDLVNARLIFGFMFPAAWPQLVQECLRILRPGGILRLTESEYGISNSLAFEQLSSLFTRALKLAGRSFSPDGHHIGITPMLAQFLRDAGYQNIRHMAHAVDYSAGTEAHEGFCQDFQLGLKLAQPFLIAVGVTTQEEADRLYQQTLEEMYSDSFRVVSFMLTVWGEKPKPT